jgi:FlaA1/EpsC-like NDP-sugar epimerase
MKRFFMTIPEAVHLVLVAGGLGTGGELFVLEMGEAIRILDLAQDVIRLSGVHPDTVPIRFSGLRPGEKLTEALWEDNAVVTETTHEGVLRVTEDELSADALQRALDELQAIAASDGDEAVQRALVEALPSYGPAILSAPTARMRS